MKCITKHFFDAFLTLLLNALPHQAQRSTSQKWPLRDHPPHTPFIHFLVNLLTFYLASLLIFYLANLLTLCLAFFLAYLLTFSRAYLRTFFLAYLVTVYLAHLLTFYLAMCVAECTDENGPGEGARNCKEPAGC